MHIYLAERLQVASSLYHHSPASSWDRVIITRPTTRHTRLLPPAIYISTLPFAKCLQTFISSSHCRHSVCYKYCSLNKAFDPSFTNAYADITNEIEILVNTRMKTTLVFQLVNKPFSQRIRETPECQKQFKSFTVSIRHQSHWHTLFYRPG